MTIVGMIVIVNSDPCPNTIMTVLTGEENFHMAKEKNYIFGIGLQFLMVTFPWSKFPFEYSEKMQEFVAGSKFSIHKLSSFQVAPI